MPCSQHSGMTARYGRGWSLKALADAIGSVEYLGE